MVVGPTKCLDKPQQQQQCPAGERGERRGVPLAGTPRRLKLGTEIVSSPAAVSGPVRTPEQCFGAVPGRFGSLGAEGEELVWAGGCCSCWGGGEGCERAVGVLGFSPQSGVTPRLG